MVTTRATLGARAITAVPMATNQGFKSIVFNNAAEGSYYFHLFAKVKPELIRRSSGTTFLEISAEQFRQIVVPSPAFPEKSLIAKILDTLDAAIRETETIIAKLKSVKQGLLHDLLTRGIDANGELRPPQSEAPHLYKDSPLGRIPNDWRFGVLGDWLHGKPKNGYSPQEAPRWTGVQMLGLGCLTPDGFQPLQLKYAPAEDRRLRAAVLRDGDLLISRSNTREFIGLVGIYRDVGTACTYPDLMMRLTPGDRTTAEFLQLVLQAPSARRQIQAAACGTSGSMVKIGGSTVTSLRVTMPDADEQHRILAALNALVIRQSAEVQDAQALRALKAGLMDDLLTGRVRVTPLLAQAAAPP
jgi:type I restriction enzyme, S subunit